MLHFHTFGEIPSHFDTCIQSLPTRWQFFFTHQWKVIHRVYNNSLLLWCVFCYPPKARLQDVIPIEKRLLSCWLHPDFRLEMKNIHQTLKLITFQCIKTIFTINTGEPSLMATLVIPSPHCYGLYFMAEKMAIDFCIKKHMLMWSAIATFTVPNSTILYNFIPLN